MNKGWQCPKCGRVYSPWIFCCEVCNKKQQSYQSIPNTPNDFPFHTGPHDFPFDMTNDVQKPMFNNKPIDIDYLNPPAPPKPPPIVMVKTSGF